MRTVLVAVLIHVFCVLPAPAGPARAGTLTPAMVVLQRGVGDVALAPDGERIAYVVSVPRPLADERGAPYQEIWVVPAEGGAARRYTPERQRAWAPAFAPDGRRLAFLSTRPTPGFAAGDGDDDRANLFVLDLEGGEARLLTDSTLSVVSFRWSPTGDEIAFVASDPETESEKKDKKAGRDWKVADRDAKPRRLWAVGAEGGRIRQVTTDAGSVWDFDWSPDGARLVVAVTATPRIDDSYMYRTLSLVPASGGAPAPLAHTEGKLEGVAFAPDGAHVAWRGATDLHDPYAGSIFVVPVAGGATRDLTRDDAVAVTWLDWLDGKTLVAAATRGTRTSIETVPLAGGTPRAVVSGGPIFTEASLAPRARRLAFAGTTPLHPAEVFAARLGKGAPRRLTTTNPDIERVQLGRQETVRWTAADGLEIEGILVRPLGFLEGRRYPLVVIAHGGPESCYRDGWITSHGTWTQLLARDGYLVLLPNYRASIGRGNAYERADHGDLAGKEFDDVVAGIDWLAERGWADPARVGIGGSSYGGYFSAWAATAHSERFACAIDFAGITNWLSMQGTSDIPEENALVHWNRPFYDNMALYWERSPLAHVGRCRTPLLVLHGDKDARVPVGQGQEIYTALRLLGREVEFVRYPRAGHGLVETAHRLDMLTRSLGWFERHLKPSGVTSRR